MSKKRRRKFRSVDKMFKEMREKEKHLYYRVYLYFYRLFFKIIEFPREVRQSIVASYQRAKRGYANRDTWGLGYYLSDVISKSVYHLKEHGYGYPSDLTEGQWVDVLNEIRDTFDTAKRITNGTLYLIEDNKKRIKWQISLDELNKKYKKYDRCMSDNEIKRYEKGWKLFKKYFFNLWD